MKDNQIRWVPVLMVAGGGFALVLGILFIRYYLSIPTELLRIGMIFLAVMPLLLGLLYMFVRDAGRSLVRISKRKYRNQSYTNIPWDLESLRKKAEKVDPDILRELGLPRLEDIDYEAEKEKWKHVKPHPQRARLTTSRLYLMLLTIPFAALAVYFGVGLLSIIQRQDIIEHLYSIPSATTDEPFLVLFKTAIFSLGLLGCLYMLVVSVLTQFTYPYALFRKER